MSAYFIFNFCVWTRFQVSVVNFLDVSIFGSLNDDLINSVDLISDFFLNDNLGNVRQRQSWLVLKYHLKERERYREEPQTAVMIADSRVLESNPHSPECEAGMQPTTLQVLVKIFLAYIFQSLDQEWNWFYLLQDNAGILFLLLYTVTATFHPVLILLVSKWWYSKLCPLAWISAKKMVVVRVLHFMISRNCTVSIGSH